jgi:hypothetical protein
MVFRANRQSREVLDDIGLIPVLDWLKPVDGHFAGRLSASARSACYVYLQIVLQSEILTLKQINLISLLNLENVPAAQEKLLKLVTFAIESCNFPRALVRDALLKCIILYYDPKKAGLGEFLGKLELADDFVDKCTDVVSQMTDHVSALSIFDAMCQVRLPSTPCLLSLLEKVLRIGTEIRRFHTQMPLDYFIHLKNAPELADLLEKAEEIRGFEFLHKLDDTKVTQDWLRNRDSISPDLLNRAISWQGATFVRQIWPSFSKIPLTKELNAKEFVSFILAFAHSDEIPFIIENYPDYIAPLLVQWTGSFTCFRCDALLAKADLLLEHDLRLIRLLLAVYPDDGNLIKLCSEKVRTRLQQQGEFDPEIFSYFKPSDDLVDEILLSDALQVIEPGDSIIPILIRRIPEIAGHIDSLKLAQATHLLISRADIDPVAIQVSPLDEPVFCYEASLA